MYQKLTKTKKLLTVAMLLIFCAFTSNATSFVGTGTSSSPWQIKDGGGNGVRAYVSGSTLHIEGSGNMADFWSSTDGEAPWNYQYYNNSSSITTVVIQSGVTNIGDRAFHDLRNLQTITIPNTVTIIGRQAFYMEHFTNTSFQSIIIPNSVREIEGEAFKNCSNLRTVTIENGSQGLDFSSFYYSGNEYPRGNKYEWFDGCPIQTLHFGRNLSSTSNNPFSGTSIQNLTIGNTVTSLGSRAFSDCTGLINVTLENGTTTLSFNYASNQFSNCPIKTFYWGRNLVQFSSPVSGKTSLTSATIGNNVASVGGSAFSGCTNLSSVTIPSSITKLESSMFYQCSSLTNFTISNNITSIESSAFQYSGLTSISIPNTVTSIGSRAFSDCTGLTEVTLENGTTTLSFNYASNQFSNCPIKTFHWGRNLVHYTSPVQNKTTLTTLTIGNNVTSIGNSDFYGCIGLTSVTIPNSVTSIGSQAFYGCNGLQTITSQNPIPPTASNNCFYDVYGTCKLYVPTGSINSYKGANEWKKFFDNNNMFEGGSSNGIDDAVANQLSIYPNPSKDGIFRFVTDNPEISWVVFDLSGKQILNGTGTVVDLSANKEGIYLIRIQDGGNITTTKLLKL